MHLFLVSTYDVQIPVFAESYDHALQIFLAFWSVRHDTDWPRHIEIKQRNPEWPGVHQDHLRVALALMVAGVGHYDDERGWTIVAPNCAEGLEGLRS